MLLLLVSSATPPHELLLLLPQGLTLSGHKMKSASFKKTNPKLDESTAWAAAVNLTCCVCAYVGYFHLGVTATAAAAVHVPMGVGYSCNFFFFVAAAVMDYGVCGRS